MKIHFFENKIIHDFGKTISVLYSITTFLFLFLPNFDSENGLTIKLLIAIGLVIISIALYFAIYIYYKARKTLKFKINATDINIFFGDIFDKSLKGKKLIAFNEFYDTKVDDVLINHNSLNGQLIDRKLIDVSKLEKVIKNSYNDGLTANNKRSKNEKTAYEIGQIIAIGDYFLLAFTRFNEKNEAELYVNEYVKCLLEMWKNLNTKYAQQKVYIPLLGSGCTRILDNRNLTKQEILETMLFTLKISMQTFKEPANINIVLFAGENNKNMQEFNFARIKYFFKEK